MYIFNKGFNYSQDGPGNRLVYHMQGCNFRCPWCSNPESMEKNGKKTKTVTPEEITAEAVSCRPMFFDGGGVTFTGGEPTLQHTELLQTLIKLKDAGIHTAMESNGSDVKLSELLPYIDYLILDIKHPDSEVHKSWTGISNVNTQKNIHDILLSGRQLHMRIPLIHGVNVVPDKFTEFFRGYPLDNAVIEILPYHEYGKDKWTAPYKMTDGFVTKEEIASVKEALEKTGLRVVAT